MRFDLFIGSLRGFVGLVIRCRRYGSLGQGWCLIVRVLGCCDTAHSADNYLLAILLLTYSAISNTNTPNTSYQAHHPSATNTLPPYIYQPPRHTPNPFHNRYPSTPSQEYEPSYSDAMQHHHYHVHMLTVWNIDYVIVGYVIIRACFICTWIGLIVRIVRGGCGGWLWRVGSDGGCGFGSGGLGFLIVLLCYGAFFILLLLTTSLQFNIT